MLPNKLKQLDTFLNESLGTTLAIGGVMTVGALLHKIVRDYRDKKVSCEHIEDLLDRLECIKGVLLSTSSSMNRYREHDCNNTPDPAECKLRIIRRQERLHRQIQNLNDRISRIKRAREERDHIV